MSDLTKICPLCGERLFVAGPNISVLRAELDRKVAAHKCAKKAKPGASFSERGYIVDRKAPEPYTETSYKTGKPEQKTVYVKIVLTGRKKLYPEELEGIKDALLPGARLESVK